MDYCEWKNGYRTEAMTSVARDLTKKLASIANNALSLQLKKIIGYDISSYTRGEAQTDNTKFGLFAMTGYSRRNNSGAISVPNVVLHNQNRTHTALLTSNNGA